MAEIVAMPRWPNVHLSAVLIWRPAICLVHGSGEAVALCSRDSTKLRRRGNPPPRVLRREGRALTQVNGPRCRRTWRWWMQRWIVKSRNSFPSAMNKGKPFGGYIVVGAGWLHVEGVGRRVASHEQRTRFHPERDLLAGCERRRLLRSGTVASPPPALTTHGATTAHRRVLHEEKRNNAGPCQSISVRGRDYLLDVAAASFMRQT